MYDFKASHLCSIIIKPKKIVKVKFHDFPSFDGLFVALLQSNPTTKKKCL